MADDGEYAFTLPVRVQIGEDASPHLVGYIIGDDVTELPGSLRGLLNLVVDQFEDSIMELNDMRQWERQMEAG